MRLAIFPIRGLLLLVFLAVPPGLFTAVQFFSWGLLMDIVRAVRWVVVVVLNGKSFCNDCLIKTPQIPRGVKGARNLIWTGRPPVLSLCLTTSACHVRKLVDCHYTQEIPK